MPIERRLPQRETPVSQAVFSHGDGRFPGQPILNRDARLRLEFNTFKTGTGAEVSEARSRRPHGARLLFAPAGQIRRLELGRQLFHAGARHEAIGIA